MEADSRAWDHYRRKDAHLKGRPDPPRPFGALLGSLDLILGYSRCAGGF